MSTEKEKDPSEPKYSKGKVCKYLRRAAESEGLFKEGYDHSFNYLRFAQGHNYDMHLVKKMYLDHLKFRRLYDLDTIDEWHNDDLISEKYFPLGLIGGTGKDNRLVVIEACGCADINGIIQSVVATDFLMHRSKFQEKVQREMNRLEQETKEQSSVIYIMDLDGLAFDPFLLPVVTGPYYNLWKQIFDHYPEWISSWYIINAPSFMATIWSAVAPLIAETTYKKIQIFSSQDQWLPILLEHIETDRLPAHWGGSMVDPKNGDPKCPSLINMPQEPIPTELYWKPSEAQPDYNELPYISVAPGPTFSNRT